MAGAKKQLWEEDEHFCRSKVTPQWVATEMKLQWGTDCSHLLTKDGSWCKWSGQVQVIPRAGEQSQPPGSLQHPREPKPAAQFFSPLPSLFPAPLLLPTLLSKAGNHGFPCSAEKPWTSMRNPTEFLHLQLQLLGYLLILPVYEPNAWAVHTQGSRTV